MTEEWFKVEVLQDYTGEDDGPSLQAWKAGNKAESRRLFEETVMKRAKDWQQSCQSKVKSGVKLTRIHVIEEPHSAYIDWELMVYVLHSIPLCGERVYLVPRSKVADLDLPSGDFMLFDDEHLVVNRYDGNGLMIDADFYDVDAGDNIDRFLKLKTELLKHAKPIA